MAAPQGPAAAPQYESLPQRPARPRRKRRREAAEEEAPAPSTTPAEPPSPPPASGRRVPVVPGRRFAYADHTADIQVHGWGETLEAAFAGAAEGMVHYMTPLDGVALTAERRIEAKGHDAESLLFNFLDEVLAAFACDAFIPAAIDVGPIDRSAWTVAAVARGETFARGMHAQGTEVKAITYSAMAIDETDAGADVYVIVDI